MHKLAAAGLTRVFCEERGSLARPCCRAGHDEIVPFTAGIVLGAEERRR
jgi:diaminohydroxyphosphoribosylaminopyrimidine deaminase/5-amino-6-(5-phosphoribosylamino)uracil reductase